MSNKTPFSPIDKKDKFNMNNIKKALTWLKELKELLSELKPNMDFVIWLMYLFLLAAQLGHTKWWLFGLGVHDNFYSGILAIAFDFALITFTHFLVNDAVLINEQGLKNRTFVQWFFTITISLFLISFAVVSAFANFSYAVEFSKPMKALTLYGINPIFYHIASGAFLPFANLAFSISLAGLAMTDQSSGLEIKTKELTAQNKKLANKNELLDTVIKAKANEQIAAAAKLENSESELMEAKKRLAQINLIRKLTKNPKSYQAVVKLFDEATSKKDKVLAAKHLYPNLNQNAIATIAGCGVSHVNQLLNSKKNGNGKG